MKNLSFCILTLCCMSLFGTGSFAAAKNASAGNIQQSAEAPAAPSSPSVKNALPKNDIAPLDSMSDPKSVQTASDDMDDWFTAVLHQFNFKSFGENNGRFILSAYQSVSLKPTDPQYGDALVNAFDMAMANLQEKYLMIRFGSETVDKIKSFYSDRSTYAKDIPLPSVEHPEYIAKILKIFDKGLDVTEKKLDQQLIKLGVDPKEVAELTPIRKKDLFREKFLKTTLVQASGSIAGLFPIQTNVIMDRAGRTIVGVVAIASSKTIQIAKDISLQRKSIIQGRGRNIESLLPKTDEEYIGTLGVRLAYDEDGSPAIISYGIASYRPDTADDHINEELKAEAKNASVSNADAQIAEIISGRMNMKNERKAGDEVRQYVEKEMKPDADTVEKTIKNIIKITTKEAKSSARTKLQGISTIKTWRYTAKSGQKFVGAVRVWKYGTLEAVNTFNNPQQANGPAMENKHHFQTFQQSSKPVNTKDDF